jgi:hypothetical protein
MHNNVLISSHSVTQSFTNIIDKNNFLNISIQNKQNIAILIHSLAIINNIIVKSNINMIQENFISQSTQYGLDVVLAMKISNIVIQDHKELKYFKCTADSFLNENIKNIIYNHDMLGVNANYVNLSNNISIYIKSIEILLKEDAVNLKLINEFLIKYYLNPNNIDYSFENAVLLFNHYNILFGFNQESLNYYIKFSNFYFKDNDLKKYKLLENFILPILSQNINLIDKKILGNLLLDFIPKNINYISSYDFLILQKLFDLFVVHYSEDRKEIFFKFINLCFTTKYSYCNNRILEILNNYVGLINQDDKLLNKIELKNIFESFFDCLHNSNNDVNYFNTFIKSIEIFKDKIGDEVFQQFINKMMEFLIKKISEQFSYKHLVQNILDKYNKIITKDNIKYFILSLSLVGKKDNIIDEYGAKKAIKDYQEIFSDKEILDLNMNLINNCLSTNDIDYMFFVKDLINNLNNKFAANIISTLSENMKNNLNDMNIIFFCDYILINHFETLNINLNMFNKMVKYLIKMKPSSDFSIFEAIKRLLKIITIQDKNARGKVIEFIELAIQQNSLLALKLIEEYKMIIDENNTKNFILQSVIKFIETCHDTEEAFYLLTNYLEFWTDAEKYMLSKLLISKNLSLVTENDICGFINDIKFENILTIMRHEHLKASLLLFEDNFYINLLSQILNNYNHDVEKVKEIIREHEGFITAEHIELLYYSTQTLAVINYIRTIQNYYNLTLPIRQDVIRNQTPINNNILLGNAFEIHNYTNGVENIILQLIQYLLKCKQINVENIDKLEFINKYVDLGESKNNLVINVLDKLEQDKQYFKMFQKVLPYLVTFLNNDDEEWVSDYKEKTLRFNMYFELSFIESAQAYGKELTSDNISCVKGLYERLFTPFRVIHPLFKLLFINQDVVKYFEHNIANELLLLSDIVLKKLTQNYKEINVVDLEENINQIFIIEFINRFNCMVLETKNLLSLNLNLNLLMILNKDFNRSSHIAVSFLNKVTSNIKNYLDNLFIDNVHIYKYMEENFIKCLEVQKNKDC